MHRCTGEQHTACGVDRDRVVDGDEDAGATPALGRTADRQPLVRRFETELVPVVGDELIEVGERQKRGSRRAHRETVRRRHARRRNAGQVDGATDEFLE